MSIEAMKQALEWANDQGETVFFGGGIDAVNKMNEWTAALRQAIEQAEKQFNPDWDQQAVLVERIRELEAQQALDKKADNARELGLDYEPTHTDHPMRHWDRTCPACVEQAEKQEHVRWFQQYGDTPPRKEWVGLTDEEIHDLRIQTLDDIATNYETYKAIEAKLKEKNT